MKAGEPFNPHGAVHLNGLALAFACAADLTPQQARLLTVLALKYVNRDTAEAYPSQALLARDLGLKRRATVSEWLVSLKDHPDVRITEQPRERIIDHPRVRIIESRDEQGKNQVHRYQLLWHPDYESIRLNPCRKSVHGSHVDLAGSAKAEPANAYTTSSDSQPRSVGTFFEPTPTPSELERARTREPQGERAKAEGMSNSLSRPTDPEEESPSRDRDPIQPTTWQPTTADAAKLLAYMQERTGGGDLAYATDALALVQRGAESIDDVLHVVRAKCRGRRVRNNGYIRQVIADHFGETVEQREERARSEQDELTRQRALRAGYEAALSAAKRTTDETGDDADLLRLVRLGLSGWLREQGDKAA